MADLKKFATLPYEKSNFFDQFKRYGYNSYDTSAKGLQPTPVAGYGAHTFCLFCGSQAHPIQAGLRSWEKNYDTTGYFCDCIHAKKWLDVQEDIQQLQQKHYEKIRELEQNIPKTNEIIKKIAGLDWDVQKAILK